jgi:hypothetical protein
MNILTYAANVNRELLTKEELIEVDFATGQEMFYQDSLNKNLFTLVYSEKGFWYHRVAEKEGENRQANCGFNIPYEIAKSPEKHIKQKRPRVAKEKLYPEFFLDECSRKLEKLALKPTLKKFTGRWKLFFKNYNDITTAFWGRAKGTPAYNEYMRRRIINTAEILANESKQCLIMTPTVRKLEDGKSRVQQWKEFARRISLLEKGLWKRFRIRMIVALESTKAMNPHAHLQLFLEEPFNDFKFRYSRSGKHKYICDGQLRKAITKLWGDEIVDLQVCRPESIKYYISKYSSKNMSLNCLGMQDKEKWSPNDIKEVATMLLPMLAEVRQFRIPRLSKKQKECHNKKHQIQSCNHRPLFCEKISSPSITEGPRTPSPEGAVLDCIRNNSPLPCLSRFFEGSFGQLKNEVGKNLDEWNGRPEEEKEKILCKCNCTSCNKCAAGLYFAQKVFGSGEMYKKTSVFDIFGYEIKKEYQKTLKLDENDLPCVNDLRSYINQKLFFKLQMPNEWSEEEKEGVFLAIENLDSCLWQFVLEEKYAKWALKVHLAKKAFNPDEFVIKENGLVPKTLLQFFPLTLSASGIMIKQNKENAGVANV